MIGAMYITGVRWQDIAAMVVVPFLILVGAAIIGGVVFLMYARLKARKK